MNPELCRSLNHMSLELLADYLQLKVVEVNKLYAELLNDHEFLSEINQQIENARRYFRKGIFRHEVLDTVDWMAIQRIMLYIMVRVYRPSVCLETGVFYGGTTVFILNALRKNQCGKLISIDLPRNITANSPKHHLVGDSEDIPEELDVGFLVHPEQKERWTLVRGNSVEEIPKIHEQVALYSHDSDHSFGFVREEMGIVWNKLDQNAIVVVDDIDWSNGFYSFCAERRLYPLVITDNGKSGLRARTGIVRLNHLLSKKHDVTGWVGVFGESNAT